MSKTNLQSTTHGGGRVVSVILAGTLAFGMTPAVALTTQSLEPMQAFAATEEAVTVDKIATAVLSYTGTDATNNNVVLGTYGTSITSPTSFKLTNGLSDDQEVVYTTDSYTVKFKDTSKSDAPLLDSLANAAAGTYAAYAVFTDGSDVTPTNNPASVTFTISAAPASGKTDLSTAFVTLSYEGVPLSTNGFVITVPTDKTLSEMQDLYEANIVVSVDGKALTPTTNYTIECTPNATATGGTMVITGAGDYENSYPAIPYTVEYEFGDGHHTWC